MRTKAEDSSRWSPLVTFHKGLEELLRHEAKGKFGNRVRFLSWGVEEEARIQFDDKLKKLEELRLITSLCIGRRFSVPRPKAFFSEEHLRELLFAIEKAIDYAAPNRFTGIRFQAAGADSPLFNKLGTLLAQRTGIPFYPEDGDLRIKFRPAPKGAGWDVIVRLTPRPLATRSWRVVNYEGALHAPIAAAMAFMSTPKAQQQVLNLFAGSGTLLIERALMGPAKLLVGVDEEKEALHAARTNAKAAKCLGKIKFIQSSLSDFTSDQLFDVILADLPWGETMQRRSSLIPLYEEVVQKVEALLHPRGTGFFLTQFDSGFVQALKQTKSALHITHSIRVSQNGFFPTIFAVKRKPSVGKK